MRKRTNIDVNISCTLDMTCCTLCISHSVIAETKRGEGRILFLPLSRLVDPDTRDDADAAQAQQAERLTVVLAEYQ